VPEKTLLELRGTSCLAITELAGMKETVSQFASRVTEKLRAGECGSLGGRVLQHEPLPEA
jgi:hypothetical protein